MHEIPPSVLLVRLDAIGDALALTPLLAALRERGIPVDIVLSDRNADIFSSRAYRRRLRAQDVQPGLYSHALVATEDAEGYRLAQRSEAPVRIGFENGWGKPFKTLWVRSLLTKTLHRTAGLDRRAPHECEVLFQLGAELLGENAKPTRDVASLRPLVINEEPQADDRIVFQVTDKWERLGIAFNDVLSCARRLSGYVATAEAHTAGVRWIASSQEDIYVDAFEQETALQVERFDTSIPWKYAISAGRALVAPDSGAIHIAGMLGIPTVAMFPSKQFALQTARWSPWAAPYRIIETSHDWPRASIEALRELL